MYWKSSLKQNYCHACHKRFAVFLPLPSCCVSSLINQTGTLKSDDLDGKENFKKAIGWKAKQLCTCITFYNSVHFFAVTVRLRRKNAWFNPLWSSRATTKSSFSCELGYCSYEFSSRRVRLHSAKKVSLNKRDMKIERTRQRFWGDAFAARSRILGYASSHSNRWFLNRHEKLSGNISIRYETLHFRDRLRSVTEIAPKSPFCQCKEKP